MNARGKSITPEEILSHAAWLRRLARALLGADPAVEDAVQEAWTAAVRARPDRERPLRPWLAHVLRNFVRKRGRDQARRVAREAGSAPMVALPGADELIARQQVQRVVAEMVLGLEEPYRSTVLLRYAEGLEPAEIAARQGIPAGTVRWRLKRGLDRIRTQLDEREGGRAAWVAVLAPLTRALPAPPLVGAAAVKMLFASAMVAAVAVGWWASAKRAPVHSARAGASAAGKPAGKPGSTRHGTLRLALASVHASPGPVATTDPTGQLPPAIRKAMDPAGAPTLGPPDAPVTLVAFLEYSSPFGAQAAKTMKALAVDYPDQLRLVVKQHPLGFQGPGAVLAAEAALAAHAQGKFWPMHDRMLSKPTGIDRAALEEYALAAGLDLAAFRAALDEHHFEEAVAVQGALAHEAGLDGTPSFLVNGRPLVGARSIGEFRRIIDDELGRATDVAPPPAPGPKSRPSPFAWPALRWPPPRLVLPEDELGGPFAVSPAPDNAPTRGDARAPVEIHYFPDYGNPWRRSGKALIDGVLSTYPRGVRVVARPIHTPRAGCETLAAEAAWAAAEQGRFWPVHDDLLEAETLDRPTVEAIAARHGLDLPRFRTALDTGRWRALVQAESAALGNDELEAALVISVNRRLGASSLTSFVQLIESELRKAGHPVPAVRPDPHFVTDPRDPGYDPTTLAPYIGLNSLFTWEPRDAAWAGPLEKEIGPIIERDLKQVAPGLTSVRFECRTVLCRLSLTGERGEQAIAAGVARQLYGDNLAGSLGNPSSQIRWLRKRGEPGTAPATIAHFKSRRLERLEALRSGRTVPASETKVARWPDP